LLKKIQRKKRARVRDNVLSGIEVKILLGALETDRERLCIEGLLFTGLRRGELVHLTRDWIQRGKIQVPSQTACDCWECKKIIYRKVKKKKSKKTVKVLRKPAGLWMPKTNAGARSIPLNELSKKLFDWYFREHHAIRELVPCTKSVYYTIKQIESRIKDQLTHELIPHGLRGVYASRLAEQGISTFKLKEIMGWAHSKVADEYIALYGPSEEAEGLTMHAFTN